MTGGHSAGLKVTFPKCLPGIKTMPIILSYTVDGDDLLGLIINVLNYYRGRYIKTKDKRYWWQLIQLLPSSYNQRRTVMLNYEVLANIYKSRRNHKLDEWHTFCDWIESLPYSKLITGEKKG